MLGWGARFLCIGFALGLASVTGCGGRTDALDDWYGDDGGSSGSGGASAGTGAGASPQGGTRPTGGTRAVGGSAPTAGRGGSTTGGVGPIGGSSFGGVGGTIVGGFGGVGGVGAFPGGGFGGFGGAGGTSPLDCQTCLTLACTPQLAQCFQDPGCIAIFGCVAATGCNTFECYEPMYCKNIIDQFGGPMGSSMNQVLDVVRCAINSGCDCQ